MNTRKVAKGGARDGAGKLRIIAGEWRSRQLEVLDLPGLRPTTDRVRETLFNWLQNDIAGAHCLDLFTGSGALSFEAASRGCASVLMLENQPAAIQKLNDNIRQLGAEHIRLQAGDAMAWLRQSSGDEAFDIVFIDPPFDAGYLVEACALLEQKQCLAEHACIYLEMDSRQALPTLPANWRVVREKKAGQVSYYLVRRNYED